MRALFVYKHDVSYTTNGATDRPRENVAPSPSRKTRPRNEPPQRQGRATPLHTRTPSPRARRRDRLAPRYTRSSSGDPAHSHVIPKGEQYPNQAASHSKSNTRREGIAQGLTKDPVQHDPVDRFTPSRDPPTKPRHQSEKQTPCIHRNTLGPPSKT